MFVKGTTKHTLISYFMQEIHMCKTSCVGGKLFGYMAIKINIPASVKQTVAIAIYFALNTYDMGNKLWMLTLMVCVGSYRMKTIITMHACRVMKLRNNFANGLVISRANFFSEYRNTNFCIYEHGYSGKMPFLAKSFRIENYPDMRISTVYQWDNLIFFFIQIQTLMTSFLD